MDGLDPSPPPQPPAPARTRRARQARRVQRVADALACPCIDDLKRSACGASFVAAFSCFHLSTAQPRGCECLAANLAFAVCGGVGGMGRGARGVGRGRGARSGAQMAAAAALQAVAGAPPRRLAKATCILQTPPAADRGALSGGSPPCRAAPPCHPRHAQACLRDNPESVGRGGGEDAAAAAAAAAALLRRADAGGGGGGGRAAA
jgi:hypothetical protein